MKINRNTALSTSKVLLVPYSPHHVQKYHTWMQDPKEIQEATASEPLTLEEEYENQVSWRQAPDKLTFILCTSLPALTTSISPKEYDSEEHMIGDVNFFLHPDADGEEGWLKGEVDIMIAEKTHLRKGIGRAAVCALLRYICRHLNSILEEYGTKGELKGLMVKIKEGNMGSRALFGKLGFRQRGEVNYFGEIEMGILLDDVRQEGWWEGAVEETGEVWYGE